VPPRPAAVVRFEVFVFRSLPKDTLLNRLESACTWFWAFRSPDPTERDHARPPDALTMATEAHLTRARGHTRTLALLAILLLLCVAVVVFPVIIMQPFVHQAALPLSLALFVQRWAPWITIVGFLSGMVLAARSRTHPSERFANLKNVLLVAAVAGLGLCVWASRINVYEMRFRPPGNVQLVPAAQALVRPDDMVLVVGINGDDRAYPVLQMAYHHLVNDVVGAVPIVSTY